MKWFWVFVSLNAAGIWIYYTITVDQPFIIHLGLAMAATACLSSAVRECGFDRQP